MGATLEQATSNLNQAIHDIFSIDSRVHAVGIGAYPDGTYGYRAVRNVRRLVAQGAPAGIAGTQVNGVPVEYVDALNDAQRLVRVPSTGAGRPGVVSLVPEQLRQRPLVAGLQLENFDDDTRTGQIASGVIVVGSLGWFCTINGDPTGRYLLSNNHVVAGENRGLKGTDRIMQPGDGTFSIVDHVATLTNYVPIAFSPAGASPAAGTAVLNDVDAGIAILQTGVPFTPGYLPVRTLPVPSGAGTPALGDSVHKVGRTTGLTRGTITSISAVVGPVDYSGSPAWFQNAFEIEGVDGTMFSDHGDSGAAIVNSATNEILGLLYAGNGQQTYACRIDLVQSQLACTVL